MSKQSTHRFSVAPMMDWTDSRCRVLHRTLSRRARLYTEMVTTGAVIHGPRERLLGFDPVEHPVAVQLGGSEPSALARAAAICEAHGYDEINLNVGCPSDRVQNGAFGACLMREPDLVAECVAAMKAVVRMPVTVKCRIGVDDQDPDIALFTLVEKIASAGADAVIVHARKAWLKGLSPKENREIPPLDYAIVHRLKDAWPDLPIAVNGGIHTIADAAEHLPHLDGVMIGRAAYQDPEILLRVDPDLFGEDAPFTDAAEAIRSLFPYIVREMAKGMRLHAMTRHMIGFFQGRPGARQFRRYLATEAVKPGADINVLDRALSFLSRDSRDESRSDTVLRGEAA